MKHGATQLIFAAVSKPPDSHPGYSNSLGFGSAIRDVRHHDHAGQIPTQHSANELLHLHFAKRLQRFDQVLMAEYKLLLAPTVTQKIPSDAPSPRQYSAPTPPKEVAALCKQATSLIPSLGTTPLPPWHGHKCQAVRKPQKQTRQGKGSPSTLALRH